MYSNEFFIRDCKYKIYFLIENTLNALIIVDNGLTINRKFCNINVSSGYILEHIFNPFLNRFQSEAP